MQIYSVAISLTWSNLANVAIPFSAFDKGVTVAVLMGCGWAAVVLVRRWLRAMDAMEARDAGHLKQILELHQEQMSQQRLRVERDERTAAVLENISKSLEAIWDKIGQD